MIDINDVARWAEPYVGIPFVEGGRDRAGLDCWGLARLVLADQAAIELPSYAGKYSDTTDAKEIGPLIQAEYDAAAADWLVRPLDDMMPLDLVLVRSMGVPMHVGVAVGSHTMLHIERGVDACLADLRHSTWQHRVKPRPYGVYRHCRHAH